MRLNTQKALAFIVCIPLWCLSLFFLYGWIRFAIEGDESIVESHLMILIPILVSFFSWPLFKLISNYEKHMKQIRNKVDNKILEIENVQKANIGERLGYFLDVEGIPVYLANPLDFDNYKNLGQNYILLFIRVKPSAKLFDFDIEAIAGKKYIVMKLNCLWSKPTMHTIEKKVSSIDKKLLFNELLPDKI